jgi:prepilin-type N-terminal cleavage/methylation domain-containing protein
LIARWKRGFTLVELLVVVSIIALLIAMLLPSLKKARDQAKRTVCASRLREVGTAIWSYVADSTGRLPYVISPMTDGTGTDLAGQPMRGFGDPSIPDDEIDPFNRHAEETPEHKQGWPMSLANTLMPTYLGSEEGVFACPAALLGWPRRGGPFRMTYRPAAANQLDGTIPTPESLASGLYDYNREHFAMLDGRIFRPPAPVRLEGNDVQSIIRAAHQTAALRGTAARDLVVWRGERYSGPHGGGINVINKRLEVEFRDQKTADADLTPHGVRAGGF